MSEHQKPRHARDSRVSLAIITEVGQANPYGNIHGGVILRLADECGALAALRHAEGHEITTAAIDSMTFLGPIHVGERIELIAEVTHVGRTSVESRIDIYAEPLPTPTRRHVAIGYGLYVALDEQGKPAPVRPLLIESDEDRRREAAAKARQAVRLARRAEAQHEL